MAMAIQLQAAVLTSLPAPEPSILPPHLMRAEDDWLRAIVSRDRLLNVLVHCSDLPVAFAIDEISLLCDRRLWTCLVPGGLALPEHDGETLVIGDVSGLTLLQQVEVYDWLDRFGGTSQILSFTSVPLWPLVERGRFLEGLFYRLNVVTLTADPVRH